MIWLVLGVLLWSVVHFIPSIGIEIKERLIERMGENAYKGVFSLCVAVSIVLIVLGWRSTDPQILYQLPDWSRPVTILLMLVAFLLMGATKHQTVIKQYIRHPQLVGLIVWAIAHLISNGDTRSLILFGGLGLWALIEISLINAREGAWEKPAKPSMAVELKGHAISVVIFIVVMFLHPYFTGMPVMVH